MPLESLDKAIWPKALLLLLLLLLLGCFMLWWSVKRSGLSLVDPPEDVEDVFRLDSVCELVRNPVPI